MEKQLFTNQMPDYGYTDINVKDILYIVFKRWWIILIFMILSSSIAYGLSIYTYKPIYYSTTSLIVGSSKTNSASPSANLTAADINLSRELVSTYAAVIKSNRVMTATAEKLDNNINPELLASYVSVSTNEDAGLLFITVYNPDPQMVVKISNAIVEVSPKILSELVSAGTIRVIDDAKLPLSPIPPEKLKMTLIGALLGLLLGVAFLILKIIIRPTILNTDDIKTKVGLSALGSLPHEKKLKWHLKNKESIPKITNPKISNSFYESIKSMRTNILYLCKQKNFKTLLVSGATENEGKTTVSVNLALSLSSHYKVLLIDADLHRPSIAKEMHTNKADISIKFLLDYPDRYKNYINIDPDSGLSLLTFKKVKEASDVLILEQLKTLIKKMEEDYDFIIIDSSPSQYNADANIIAQAVDSMVLVIRQNQTPLAVINQAKNDLIMVRADILGAVLSDASYIRLDTASRYRYYQYK